MSSKPCRIKGMRKIILNAFLGECDRQRGPGQCPQQIDWDAAADATPPVIFQDRHASSDLVVAERFVDEAPAPTRNCILVIDDSAVVRKAVETALRPAGYQVWSFPTGIDAMKWLAEPGSRTPDLIFVDIGLPKMDGYEVIRMFKERPRFAHTVYIVLSRRDGMADRLKGRLAGAQAHITKPFARQTLLAAVQTHLSGIAVTEHSPITEERPAIERKV